MSEAQGVLDIIKQARQERRADLQEIADSHIGITATSILLLNQAQLNCRLTGADPNAVVDVPVNGNGGTGEPQGPDFSTPGTGAT